MEQSLEGKIKSLQVQNRLLFLLIVLFVLFGFTQRQDTLTTKQLVIVDHDGKPRIILGAPVDDSLTKLNRNTPTTGMVILNKHGDEQFGVGVDADNNIKMGFDAPKGAGDDTNTERINIGVTPQGNATIRMNDAETKLVSHWTTNAKAGVSQLNFVKWVKDEKSQTRLSGVMRYGLSSVFEPGGF